MPQQQGRNAGVTGLVDLGGAPKFTVRIYRFGKGLQVARKPRSGRGQSGKLALARSLSVGGTLALTGEVIADGYPLPTTFEGQEGSITLTFAAGKTVTVAVAVTASNIGYDFKSSNLWNVTLTCEITAQPAWTGWATTQPAATAPSLSDRKLWAGSSKTVDPDTLQDTVTDVWDVVGITADTDVAERQKLADIIAAATTPPFAGMKLRSATMSERDAFGGATVTVTWGRTTSGEDVVNPLNVVSTDPLGIESAGQSAAINGVPATPANAELQEVAHSSEELNDTNTLNKKRFEVLNSHQKLEYPQDVTESDPQHLADSVSLSDVFPIATPPADPAAPDGMVLRQKIDRPVTPTQSIRIYRWAYTGTKDDQELPHRKRETDPDGLEDSGMDAQVYAASDSAPAPPTIAGLKLRSFADLPVQSNPAYQVRIWTFARTTSGEEIINKNTSLTTDGSGLETVGRSAAWNTAPTPHTGLVVRKETVIEFTDGMVLHTTEEGLESVQAERERRASRERIDANQIAGQQVVAVIASTEPSSPTAPDGQIFSHWEKTRQEDGRYLWVAVYDGADSKQAIEFASTFTVDASTLDSRAELFVVQSSDAPTPPATPFTGGVCTDSRHVKQVSQTRYVWAYLFAYESNAQKLVREATREHMGDWSANATTAALDGTPAAHGTLVETGQDVLPQPNGHALNLKRHGLETDPDKWVREGTRSTIDPDDIASEAEVAQIGSEPDVPAGLEGYSLTTVTLIDGTTGYRLKAAKAGTIARMTAAKTLKVDDVGHTGLNARMTHIAEEISIITNSATAPATSGAISFTISDVVHVQTHSSPVPENPVYWMHTFLGGYRTTAEEMEDRQSETTFDPAGISDSARVACLTSSATPPTPIPSAPIAGQVHVRTVSVRHGLRWAHVFYFDWYTALSRRIAEQQHSTLTAMEYESAVTVDHVTPTTGQTVRDVAAAQYTAIQSTGGETLLEFDRMEVREIKPGQVEVVKHWDKSDKLVTSDFRGQYEESRSLGSVVHVTQVEEIGDSGYRNIYVNPYNLFRIRGPLVYHRKVLSAGITDDLLHWSCIGRVNSDVFLGINPGWLRYVGPKLHGSTYVSGSRVWLVDFVFEFDSEMHKDDGLIQLGWSHTDATVSVGAVSAATLGWTVTYPASAAFVGTFG